MKEINFELESICPLKMDRWTTGVTPKNDEGYKKQAEEKVYMDEDGNLAIPSGAVKAAIKYASSEIGKKTMAKKNRQTIMSGVFVLPNSLTMLPKRKKHDGIVEDVVTRGQGTKVTRVVAYRPLIKKWSVKGKMQFMEDISEDFLKSCLELAGLRYGLLSHRPEFGRFMIKNWEVNNGNDKHKGNQSA